MPLALLIRRSSFVAVALGFTAFAVTATPVAAQPQPFPVKGQLPQSPMPKPVFNPSPFKPVVNPGPFKPVLNPNPPKPVVNPPKPVQPGPIVKPIDICVIAPSKCVKPVVVNPPPVIVAPPPVVVEAPPHIIARPEPVYVPRPVQASAAATSNPSCSCLTKQYQSDGSVVFRDLCTHEAAMATKEDLKAQGQATAQEQTQAAPAR